MKRYLQDRLMNMIILKNLRDRPLSNASHDLSDLDANTVLPLKQEDWRESWASESGKEACQDY